MGVNSEFKGLKWLKTPGNGRLNNLNDLVLNVVMTYKAKVPACCEIRTKHSTQSEHHVEFFEC